MAPTLITSLRERPILLGGLILTFFLFLSSFHHPSPTSTTLQFPGLLPSTSFSKPYHPSSVLSSSSGPIYTSPQLTREQERRYAHLRHPRIPGIPASSRLGNHGGKYLFTTLTRNIEDQLPDLINTVYILIKFLGSDRVRFSIYEGPSSDSTSHIINTVLVPLLRSLGVPESEIVVKTDQPEIDFNMVNRIQALAVLRNEALAPLWNNEAWSDTAAVVYFNDVYLRAKDVLELLHQHVKAGEKAGVETGVTTGMDWWRRHPAYYYDVWVARTITGDLFYPIDGPSWTPSDQILSTHIPSREAYDRLDPFQVFSSWAGMAVLAATPFLSSQHRLRFRRADPTPDPVTGESECAGSECEMLCRDMWKLGWGRVQVVPSVQLAYERDVAIDTAESLSKRMEEVGFYEETPNPENDRYVSWSSEPPEKVRCHSWPEKLGLDGNVWEQTDWTRPYDGYGA